MKKTILLIFVHVIMTLTFGGMIYLLFRVKSLLMFRWADAIGVKPVLDDMRVYCTTIQTDNLNWFFFSLPDGLWVYSFTSFMLIVWGLKFSRHSIFWISIGPLLALCGEMGQAFGVIRGTFDPTDFLLCLIGSILPFVVLFPAKREKFYSNKGAFFNDYKK